MESKNHFVHRVNDFHKTFGVPVKYTPGIPNEARCKLRVELLSEELKELQEAIGARDVVGIADALADLQYVLSGAILEFGMGNIFPLLFDEVHRSNMSKACESMNEAFETIAKYKDEGTEAIAKAMGSSLLVYRVSDEKILKSINYSPAKLRPIIEGY